MGKEVRNEIQEGIDKGLDALADASGWDRDVACAHHQPLAIGGAGHVDSTQELHA